VSDGRSGSSSISWSVGDSKWGAPNNDSDVKVVSGLLNAQMIYRNRSDRLWAAGQSGKSGSRSRQQKFMIRPSISSAGDSYAKIDCRAAHPTAALSRQDRRPAGFWSPAGRTMIMKPSPRLGSMIR